ncbi:MAG: hypothetical protein OXE41_03440 [Gammaproteobacteria bacterium]|nr:hypothetical protein [Gammaproteobacteria bacterium]MCY4218164.1 hypothetical protein [Gammaproteobacteria bacterium]MCY4274440.1 hypothetical protein [Gammaproteobacteria bacterium]
MEKDTLELPSAYDLLEVAESDDIRKLAAITANDGGGEGTLIWLKKQTAGHEWDGRPWYSEEGDLHCSVLLEPEFERQHYAEMLLVASVSMGQALAQYLSPMTALGYDWPDKLMIANHVVGRVWVQYGGESKPWLSISSSINILNAPEDFSIPAISVREAEGKTELNAEKLLQAFSREFITWINHWNEKGFLDLLDRWKVRGNQPGSSYESGLITGTLHEIDSYGNLIVQVDTTQQKIILLESYVNKYSG